MAAQQVRTASAPGSGVLLSGGVPPLADAYFTRAESGLDLASSLRPGETVVLVHGAGTDVALAAQGGTGNTQLAVEFAHVMWNTRAVEILVWVSAASRESVITGFAQAANMVHASQPYEGAEIAAARLVAWLDRTRRPWALIIDDLAELSDLEELWPTGASGRVLITTRAARHGICRDLPSTARLRRQGPAGHPGARAEPPGGPGLHRLQAHRLPRPADRGAGPGRGPRRPAARARPGHRGDERPQAGLPGDPRAAGRAAPAHAGRGRRFRRRSWPPGPSPRSARTSCCWPGWPSSTAPRRPRDGPPRGAWRRAHRPGRLRLHPTGLPSTATGADQNVVRAAIKNRARRSGHHRPGQPGAHRADARQRAGRRARLPACC